MDFFVATMSDSDIGAVAEMLQECDVWVQKENVEENLRLKQKKEPNLTVVAWCNSRIVGFIMASFDGMIAMITHFYVMDRYRGKGIADELAREIERRLIDIDAISVVCLIKAENLRLKDTLKKRYLFEEGIDLTMLSRRLGAR